MSSIKEVGLFNKDVLEFKGDNFLDYITYIVKDVETNFDEHFDNSVIALIEE